MMRQTSPESRPPRRGSTAEPATNAHRSTAWLRCAVAVLGVTVSGAGLVPHARAEGGPEARLPHEYIDPAFLRRHDPLGTGGGRLVGPSRWPDAIERDGERLPAPTEGEPRAADALEIPTEAHPDRRTKADAPLTYHALYNPSVAPLRRNVAFDAIAADHTLSVAAGPHTPVAVGPATPTPGAEVFWGEITVSLGAAPAPVPSVSPAMRILAVRTSPDVAVVFERDGADNYLVSPAAGGSRRAQTVKLSLLVEAEGRYFGAPVPDQVALSVLAGHPATALPPALAAEGREVLAALEIDPDAGFRAGLDRMVGWFRGFAASDQPPPKRGSIYLDLALGKVGVCRHRAFAFLITARVAGVPTRVVHNEAHAFVEVLAPDGAWRRVDLGGEAPSLSFEAHAATRMHVPPPDGFPQPESWRDQYSARLPGGAGEGRPGGPKVEGAPPALGKGEPGAAPDSAAQAGAPAEGEGAGAGAGGPSGQEGGSGAAGPGTGEAAPVRAVPLPALPSPAAEHTLAPEGPNGEGEPGAEGPLPVEVRLDTAVPLGAVFRGDVLPAAVTGRVDTAAGTPARGVRVQVYLVGSDGRGVLASPPGQTDAEGRFTLKAQVPATLGPGRYTLVVASAPARGLGPSRSDVHGRPGDDP